MDAAHDTGVADAGADARGDGSVPDAGADAPDDASVPAVNCAALHAVAPELPTGFYTIRPAGLAAIEVYCDMDRFGGGWTRVAIVHAPSGPCPDGWVKADFPGVCTRPWSGSGSQASARFPSLQSTYSEVMGFMTGLQYSTMDGFVPSRGAPGIRVTDNYVDGVSITTNEESPQHVWTYAVAWSDDDNSEGSVCPCFGGEDAPGFVGSHYYCESGTTGRPANDFWYQGDPLWDGDGLGTNCDTPANPSVFSRALDHPTDVALHVRLMAHQESDNEDVGIIHMELFVR